METARVISSDTNSFSGGEGLFFVYTGAIRRPCAIVGYFVYSGSFFEVIFELPARSFPQQGSFFRNNILYHHTEKISTAENQSYQKIRKV